MRGIFVQAAWLLGLLSAAEAWPEGRASVAFGAAPAALAEQLRGFALRGTLVFSDPSQSIAIVELDGGETQLVRAGAVLPRVGVVERVERQAVYIASSSGVLVQFGFNDSPHPRGGSARAVTAAATGASRAPVVVVAAPVVEYEVAGTASAAVRGRPFVVPEYAALGMSRPRDAQEASLDATPRDGETIDTTDWSGR